MSKKTTGISFKTSFKRIFEHALLEAKNSPDKRQGVGAVITDSSFNIISVGYNSKPIKSKNYSCCINKETGKSSDDLLHAEERAIIQAGFKQCKDGYIFVTHCPCCRCAGRIAEAGISKVYFLYNHDNNAGAILLKEDYGIDVFQVMNVRKSIDKKIKEEDQSNIDDHNDHINDYTESYLSEVDGPIL